MTYPTRHCIPLDPRTLGRRLALRCPLSSSATRVHVPATGVTHNRRLSIRGVGLRGAIHGAVPSASCAYVRCTGIRCGWCRQAQTGTTEAEELAARPEADALMTRAGARAGGAGRRLRALADGGRDDGRRVGRARGWRGYIRSSGAGDGRGDGADMCDATGGPHRGDRSEHRRVLLRGGRGIAGAVLGAGASLRRSRSLVTCVANPGSPSGSSWRLDVAEANRDQLLAAGVRADRIFACGLCTKCRPDVFDSYRADQARAGRMAAVIVCPG